MRLTYLATTISVLAAAFALSLPAHAGPPEAGGYQKRVIAGVRASSTPAIDGDLSDGTWAQAARAETFIDPRRGQAVAEQTDAWICYDEKYIYVAFHCRDSQPAGIVGRETVRDSRYQSGDSSSGEDSIELTLDPFRSCRSEDFARFSVNPLGTPSARVTGGRASKAEWKGDWLAAARRAADGWTAEMRVPWAILNYPRGGRPLQMGINFSRWHERLKQQSIWSDIGPQSFQEYEGTWANVEVPAEAFRPTLSLLPHTLSGFNAWSGRIEAGIDARYTVTPELAVVGALNPDFATIEGAVEGIAFSRAERYIPERRPFFLEGRDYLQYGDDYQLGNHFYSRRLGSFDFGSKLYGRLTASDAVGFLHTYDASRGSNVVAKFEHTLSASSFAGLFFANRTAPGDNNTVGVAYGRRRWGKFGVESQWAFSSGQDAGGGAHQAEVYYSDKGHFTSLQVVDVSPTYRNANGYVPFTDYKGFRASHDWSADWRKGPWRGFWVEAASRLDWHQDGRPFRRSAGMDGSFTTRGDIGIGGSVSYSRFDDQTDFTYGSQVTFNSSNRFRRYGIAGSTGSIGGRAFSYLGPFVSLRTLRRFDISYSGAIQQLGGIDQQHIVTLNYELSPTRSFGGRLVLQNHDLNWYVSYRSAGALGTEVFVILGDPNADRFVRKLSVKVVTAL